MAVVIGVVAVKGGAGSGNWGHAGRPGRVGGSGGAAGVAKGMALATLSVGWDKKKDRDNNNAYTRHAGSYKAKVNSMDMRGSRWAVTIIKGNTFVYGTRTRSEATALHHANNKLDELAGEN